MKNIKIYQLNDKGANYMFRPYRENNVPNTELYDEVYSGNIEEGSSVMDTLENVFRKFNIAHPADFKGHSLSMSDVVMLDEKYYYCDRFGFVELKNWK